MCYNIFHTDPARGRKGGGSIGQELYLHRSEILLRLLLVADPSRSDQTICLAVSPALKAIGVSGRPRLFEAKQAIRRYEAEHHTKIRYITAVPRMAEYERISALIYSIYLRYVSPEDVHVYSIDECFIDCTAYLHLYRENALTLDWRQPLSAFDGQTAFDVAKAAFDCHKSQKSNGLIVQDWGPYANNVFGLYYSAVGPDEQGNDLFEHIGAEQ